MRRALALLTVTALPAAAQVSSEGHFYTTTCNAAGYVLTSDHPVGRFSGTGANTTVSEGREIMYLGIQCDAARTGWTEGKWCWANGGFRVDFAEYGIGFPRQELFCPPTQTDVVPPAKCGC